MAEAIQNSVCVSCHCVTLSWHLECAEPGGHSGHQAWEMWEGLVRSHHLEVHFDLVQWKG